MIYKSDTVVYIYNLTSVYPSPQKKRSEEQMKVLRTNKLATI